MGPAGSQPGQPYSGQPYSGPPYSGQSYPAGGATGQPPYGYAPGGGGTQGPKRNWNALLGVIGAVVVIALVGFGVFTLAGGKKKSNATVSSVVTPSAGQSVSSSAGATGSAAGTTDSGGQASASPAPTSGSTSSSTLNRPPCTGNAASAVISVAIGVSFMKDYASSSPYFKNIVDSCVAPSAKPALAKYYGKSFTLFPLDDSTGADGEGNTAKYTVTLTNTTTKVTFNLRRKPNGGYQIVTIT